MALPLCKDGDLYFIPDLLYPLGPRSLFSVHLFFGEHAPFSDLFLQLECVSDITRGLEYAGYCVKTSSRYRIGGLIMLPCQLALKEKRLKTNLKNYWVC